MVKYSLIYAVPPWTFRNKASDGAPGVCHKYQTMTVQDICRLPERLDASICQHITEPRMDHSAKPPEIRDLLIRMLGDVPRIELFARQSSHGFDVWGNQCDGPAVQLQTGKAIPITNAV